MHHKFNGLFERLRFRYIGLLDWSFRAIVGACSLASASFLLGSLGLVWLVGEDFFPPSIPARCAFTRAPHGGNPDQRKLKVRFAAIEREIRQEIPARWKWTPSLITSVSRMPGPVSGAGRRSDYLQRRRRNPDCAERETQPHPGFTKKLRCANASMKNSPIQRFFFQPANITNQILNFGLPAPTCIDLQVVGRDAATPAIRWLSILAERLSHIPGSADVHVHQVVDQPTIFLNVDRTKAGQLGLTQHDVTSNMLISLSGNNTVAPNFWVGPNGVNYNVGVQTPQYKVDSLDALLRTPVTSGNFAVSSNSGSGNASIGASPNGASQAYGNPGAIAGSAQLQSNLVTVKRGYAPVIVNHYNVWPVFDIYANVDRRDLGGVRLGR